MSNNHSIKRQRRKVTLCGAVGIAEAVELREALLPLLDRQTKVTLDLSGLERLDTAALQVLACFVRDCSGQGIVIDWKEPAPCVHDAVQLSGLAKALPVTEQSM